MSMYPACQSYPVLPYSFQNLINSSTNKCFVLQQWRLFGHVSAAAVLKVFVGSFSDVYLSVVEKSTLASERLENLVIIALQLSLTMLILRKSFPRTIWYQKFMQLYRQRNL